MQREAREVREIREERDEGPSGESDETERKKYFRERKKEADFLSSCPPLDSQDYEEPGPPKIISSPKKKKHTFSPRT